MHMNCLAQVSIKVEQESMPCVFVLIAYNYVFSGPDSSQYGKVLLNDWHTFLNAMLKIRTKITKICVNINHN